MRREMPFRFLAIAASITLVILLSATLTGVNGLAAWVNSQDGDSCLAALSGDQVITGQWVEECTSENNDGSYARYYSFTLAEESEVTITLESTIDTYLYLRAGDAKSGTSENDPAADDDAGGGTNSQVQETLAAGRYTIEATTYEPGETGSFTLTLAGLSGTAAPPGAGTCETTPLTADGPTDGTWANDCESIDQAGSYARYYSFTLAEESEVTITLESTIDTYLYLRAGDAKSGTSENDPAADDDAGGGTNAQVQETLAAGRYTIEATTYEPGETGSFTLTLAGLSGTAAPPGAGTCETTPLTADGPTDGTWANDCESIDQAGSYARYYSFTLAEESEVTITLESTIDTYLYLRAGDAKSGTSENDPAADDDAGGGTNSQVQETLAAGRYTIEATTYEPGETGSFTLTLAGLSGTAAPPGAGTCETTPLTADGPTDGTWANDCESIDQAGSYARYYSFTLAEESEVTITLESTIDTYLYLRAGDAKSGTSENDPAADDDAGDRHELPGPGDAGRRPLHHRGHHL